MNEMKRFIATLLRFAGLLKYDLLIRYVPTIPDRNSLPAGYLVVVQDGDILKWACISCPGGCGETISLSLNPNRRPRWSIVSDWWCRPSVSPSVHQKNSCGCHFWIRNGEIHWCAGGRPRSD